MKYIFGNWKMYLDLSESRALAEAVVKEDFDSERVRVALFPSALALSSVIDTVRGSQVAVGAQDVYWTPKGAYTGAISALMYKSAGCKYALVGHSERRHVFGETDADVRKKIEACLDAGLVPVVCVGETKEERDNGKLEYRLKKQLMKSFDGLRLNGSQTIVAYEPVWAIGTGEPCDPAEAERVHYLIKQELKQYFELETPVLYGGSVDEKNASDYVGRGSIDGLLIGGASTKLDILRVLVKI